MVKLSKDNMVKGKVYYIHIHLPRQYNPIWIQEWYGPAIEIKSEKLENYWRSYDDNIGCIEIREATPEEREWLYLCVNENKFLPKPNKTNNIVEIW